MIYWVHVLLNPNTTGYSSVGRASDCSLQQQSDGPWFDSGWPDIHNPNVHNNVLTYTNIIEHEYVHQGSPVKVQRLLSVLKYKHALGGC